MRLERDQQDQVFIVHSEGVTTAVARRERLRFYIRGTKQREGQLRREYLLDHVPFTPGDVVIDIGANIGEVSRLLVTHHAVRPLAIEPDRREFRALTRNLDHAGAEVWNALLWSEQSAIDFYDANDSGDSSVFAPRSGLPAELRAATTLDLLLEDSAYRDSPIRLIKLEAEGAEPEILAGATRTLERTEFVTADLGPERGLDARSTLIPVYDMLSALGFKALDVHAGRLVLLFQRP